MSRKALSYLTYLIGFLPFILPSTASAATYYYVSPTGSDISNGTIAAPFRTIQKGLNTIVAGDTLYIRGGTYHEKPVLNKSGTSTNWITISGYSGETAVLDGTNIAVSGNTVGLFTIRGNSYIKLSNLTINNTSGNGLVLQITNGIRPTNIIVSGLKINNPHIAGIRANSASYLTVENNVIKDCALSSGIGIWQSDHVKVNGNTIVNCHWQTQANGAHEEALTISKTNNFEIFNNELYFSGKTTPLGSIGIMVKQWSYTGAVHHNYVHDFTTNSGITIDAEDAGLNGKPTLHDVNVYANRLVKTAGGITLSSEWNSTPSGILENVNVYNNIMTHNSQSGIRFNNNDGDGLRRNVNLYNNTIYDSGGNGGAGILVKTAHIQNIILRNNIVVPGPTYKNAMIKIDLPAAVSQIIADHNIIQGTTTCTNEFPNCVVLTKGNLQVDPQFINPVAGDFHLKSTSPAINAGVTFTQAANDYEGTSRPQGSGYDIGAFEYHPATSTTSISTLTPFTKRENNNGNGNRKRTW